MVTRRGDAGDSRPRERIQSHYEIERALADKLRNAPPEERGQLYASLYEELFRRVPDHPQHAAREEDVAARAAMVQRHLALLWPYLAPHSVFLEVGAGDCRLAEEVARRVKHVYAVEISATIAAKAPRLPHFELVLSDGISIPVPDGSVDIAFSYQLMEHLHPDDATAQLVNIHRALPPGGRYLCLTPNQLTGPHDVTRHFTSVATGFHLREYTMVELVKLFREAGFRDVHFLVSMRIGYLRTSPVLLTGLEFAFRLLPTGTRRAVARHVRPNLFTTSRIVGVKQESKYFSLPPTADSGKPCHVRQGRGRSGTPLAHRVRRAGHGVRGGSAGTAPCPWR